MKKSCKIIFSLLLCVTLVFATLGVTSYAADTLDVLVKADNTELKAGQTVTLTLEIAANPGISSLTADIAFDASKVECVASSESVKQLEDAATFSLASDGTLRYELNMGNTGADGNIDNTGVMASVQFKIKNDADGKIDFDLSVSKANRSVEAPDGSGFTEEAVESTAADASVNVATGVTEIKLNTNFIELNKGESAQLTATVSPSSFSDAKVTWISSDNKVVTVDQSGNVTGLNAGTALITAKAGDVETKCSIRVNSPLKGISIEKEISLGISSRYTLKVTYDPADTTSGKAVMWSSSDPSVARVDGGIVTALSNGNAIITAKCGEFTAQCIVTVKNVPVTSIELDKTSIVLNNGMTQTLKATLYPADHTQSANISWSSSNPAVANVSSDGTVTALSGGNATITASVGSVKATCAVMVNNIPAQYVTLDKTAVSMKAGEKTNLKATVKPSNSTDPISFVSSNQSVAIVDDNGAIIAVGEGTAVITVIAGERTSACTVTVSKSTEATNITGVEISDTKLTLNAGDKYTLAYTVTPNGETPKSVIWASSSEKVATVSQSGEIVAVAPGNAQITILVDSSVKAVCELTVTEFSGTNTDISTDVTTDVQVDGETADTTLPYGMGDDFTLQVDDGGKKNSGAVFKIILIIIIILILLFIAITIIYFIKKRNSYDDDDEDDYDDDDYDFDDED